jgi:hypothetical protein
MKYTLQPIGNINRCDFIILPKEIAVGCSMSADAFDKLFWSNLSSSENNRDAYEKTEQIHEEFFEHRKYSDYETYKSSKSQRMKK